MTLLVHDYGGYSFPLELSRELARRGHTVHHVYSGSIRSARGVLRKQTEDSDRLVLHRITAGDQVESHRFLYRAASEIRHGLAVARLVNEVEADTILSADSPPLAQQALLTASRRRGSAFIFWLQDIYGIGARAVLQERWGSLGSLVARVIAWIEKRQLVLSDHVVAISEDFEEYLLECGIPAEAVTVIPNWASLDEVPVRSKSNQWAVAHGLDDSHVFLYSGTIGMKHDPGLILRVACTLEEVPGATTVVVSEGPGARWLQETRTGNGLRVLPFQALSEFPDVLGSADVLLAVLNESAGAYSVPSKILSYLCAGRPILLIAPRQNRAARVLEESGGGIVVAPDDAAELDRQVLRLARDEQLRDSLGANGRAYAEREFDIDKITDSFEVILAEVS